MSDKPGNASPPPKSTVGGAAPDASRAMTLFVMIVVILYFGEEVLVPITLALLLAFILAPLVDLLRWAHLGRVPAVLLAVVLALAVILGIGGVIGSQIAGLSTHLPGYVATVETKIADVRSYVLGRMAHMADSLVSMEVTPPSHHGARPVDTLSIANPPLAAPATMQPTAWSPWGLAQQYLGPALAPIATVGIVLVVAVFALLQREDLRDRLIRLLGSGDLRRTTLAIDDAGRRLSRYFLTQVSVNTLFGVVIGIGLVIIGVPNPILWGIISSLLRFVPYIGSIISAVLPMALAAAVEPGWSMVIWTAGLYLVVESMTGQIIEPMVYGHSTGLSPFSVIVAAIFWSWLWGPIGLILSTPLTLCLVVIGRHVRRFEFLDVMLGDSAPLTPVETFYRRLLAGDSDEAQEHAERMLKEMSLSAYYDEVALKGLQLAANDAERGSLDGEQSRCILTTFRLLLRSLASHDDRQPKPLTPAPDGYNNTGLVLCIAGRGPLDEAASTILLQLLGKQGMDARTVNYAEVSRDTIDALDVKGVVMACISYLDISRNPPHLRFLVERLRQRLPRGTPISVGFWASEAAVPGDDTIPTTAQPDFRVTSFSEAVATCGKVTIASRKSRDTARI